MKYSVTLTTNNLYTAIRTGFAAQNSTLLQWCINNRVSDYDAQNAIMYEPQSELVQRILAAAGVQVQSRIHPVHCTPDNRAQTH